MSSKIITFDRLLNVALIGMLIYVAYTFSGLLYPSAKVATPEQAKVLLYATKWCPSCIHMRGYFNKNKIAYYEYDLEKSDDHVAKFRQLGGVGVPLMVVGNIVIHGANTKKLEAALKQGSKHTGVAGTAN